MASFLAVLKVQSPAVISELFVLSVNQETQQTLSLFYTVLLSLWHPHAPVKFHPRMEDPRSQAHELTSSHSGLIWDTFGTGFR